MEKARKPIAMPLLLDLRSVLGSIFTPREKTKSMKPKSESVSNMALPFGGNTLVANAELRPKIEGPKTTPP